MIVVTSPGQEAALIVRASLNIHSARKIANAFTGQYNAEAPIHDLLVSNFGKELFRWYCIDMSANIYQITFSNSVNPRVLSYQGAAAGIAGQDRARFSLKLQHVDVIKPGPLNADSSDACHIV